MKNCTNCGQELFEDCVFCWKCGASTEGFISNEEISISKNASTKESQGLELGIELKSIGTCRDKDIVIPKNVTSIGRRAFKGYTGLTSITIPNSVTSIGDGVFHDCVGLTSITIPDSVKSIAYSAFNGCTSLNSITIPDSVKSIENYAFSNCTGLKEIKFLGTKKQWNTIKKGLYWDYNTNKFKVIFAPTSD